jgi:predicted site-specific integrase-resolvase
MKELSKKTGIHRNTIYRLLKKGQIMPDEIISNIRIFTDDTVEKIISLYKNKKRNTKETNMEFDFVSKS